VESLNRIKRLFYKKECVEFHSRMLAFHGAGAEPPRRYSPVGSQLSRSSHRSRASLRSILDLNENTIISKSFHSTIKKINSYKKECSIPLQGCSLSMGRALSLLGATRLWGLSCPAAPIGVEHPCVPF